MIWCHCFLCSPDFPPFAMKVVHSCWSFSNCAEFFSQNRGTTWFLHQELDNSFSSRHNLKALFFLNWWYQLLKLLWFSWDEKPVFSCMFWSFYWMKESNAPLSFTWCCWRRWKESHVYGCIWFRRSKGLWEKKALLL